MSTGPSRGPTFWISGNSLDIWQFIAADSERAADRTLSRFEKTLLMLCEHPNAGRARPELLEGLRSIAVGNYVIFYLVSSTSISVVRVLQGHRDVDAEFDTGH